MKKIILFVLLVVCVALYSEITIDHTEPYVGYKDSNLKLEITIEGNWQDVTELMIYYRERGEVAYNSISVAPQTSQNGDFNVSIPVSKFARGLEYYIEVSTEDAEVVTYPESQPNLNPVIVQIIENALNTDFVILNELKDIEVGSTFSLSVSLFNVQDKIDYTSIKFYKDGDEVTKDLIITPTLLVYNIEKIDKNFSFQITAQSLTGEKMDSGEHSVELKFKMFTYELPYNLRGSVNYKGNTNKFSYDDSAFQGSEQSTNSHSAILNISGNNRYSRLNSRIYLSSLEDSNKQSVNRYSFDIGFPHADLYLGDKSPYLSEFTLNSTNVRGFGSKLNFKYFLLEGYWGNSAREISTKEVAGVYQPGTFKRETGAIRLALGNQNAFQIGLNLVKNKDRISSLSYSDYYIPFDEVAKDDINESDKQIINPIDNIVFSTDLKLTTPQKLFNFGAEFAMSAYNSNIIDGAISQEELENDIGEDMPFDPESLDGFFVINKNTEPLSITTANLAYRIYTSTYISGNLISLNYSQVGSAFNSLSARNVNSDTKELTISDNMNFHNIIFLDFSFNRVVDNLSENLATTNEYSNYRVNSIFRKEKFPMLRFSFNKGRTSIENNDEIAISDDFDESQEFRTTAYGAGIGYNFDIIPIIPFSLDFDYQNSLDEDDLREAYEFENNSYYFRYRSKMTVIPLSTEVGFNLTSSTGYTQIIVPAKEDSYYQQKEEWERSSLRLKLKYELVDSKLIPFFDYRFSNNENELDNDLNNSYSATSFGLNYYPFKLTSISSSLTFKEKSYEIEGADYSAVNWYLNIVQKF